jgi:hypothetical protein
MNSFVPMHFNPMHNPTRARAATAMVLGGAAAGAAIGGSVWLAFRRELGVYGVVFPAIGLGLGAYLWATMVPPEEAFA